MIKQSSIDDVLAKTSIVDVISKRVDLKKAGKSYVGLCPFHNENTPSFNVTEHKEMCHCFGCGAGGNVIDFVMKYESIEFVEAVKMLAQESGITLEYEYTRKGSSRLNTAITDEEAASLIGVINNTFIDRRNKSLSSSAISISDNLARKVNMGYAYPNKKLFDIIEDTPKLKSIAKHIKLIKWALISEDNLPFESLPLSEPSGKMVGIYINSKKPEIIGPSSYSYNNLSYGHFTLDRVTDIKLIVDNPMTVLKCVDSGLTDVLSPVTSNQLFNRKLVDAGNKSKTYLVFNKTPKNLETLETNLLSYFTSYKCRTDFRVLILPPNVNIADIFKTNGKPILDKLLSTAVCWDKLLANILSTNLKESNNVSTDYISELIHKLYSSTKMDNSAFIDTSFLAQRLADSLSLDYDKVILKTSQYATKVRVELENKAIATENIKQIEEMTRSINGVQQSSLDRLVALVSINSNMVETNSAVKDCLQNIYAAIGQQDTAFTKMMESAADYGFMSTSQLYQDFNPAQRETISKEVGFLLQYSNNGGDADELNQSLRFVCDKLKLDYIDSLPDQSSAVSMPC